MSVPNYWAFAPLTLPCFNARGELTTVRLEQNYAPLGSDFQTKFPDNNMSLDHFIDFSVHSMIHQSWLASVAVMFTQLDTDVSGDDKTFTWRLPPVPTELFA